MRVKMIIMELFNHLQLLLKSKDLFLRLSALRFFKSCLVYGGEFYVGVFLKTDILNGITTAFYETFPRHNLVHSACLDFFDFIKKVFLLIELNQI